MAREIVWTGFVTVDGSIDSPGGPSEGHPRGGWVFDTPFSLDAFALKGEELAETSALLLGRRSYEAFASVWPASEDHAAYRDIPKHVVSTTVREEDLVDGWGEQRVLRSTDDVAALRETDGGAIFIHGSGGLARRLAAAGLVDRYHLLVFPYLLAGGARIVGDDVMGRTDLRLRDSEAYENGVVKLVYDVVR